MPKHEEYDANEVKEIPIYCPACGKSISKDHPYCPFCGVKIDEKVIEQQKQTSTRESVKEHIKDIESSRVNPQWLVLIAGVIALVGVCIALFSNGFGLYRTGSTNPVAIYFDAAKYMLSSKSASFEIKLTADGTATSASGYFTAGKTSADSVVYFNETGVENGYAFAQYNGQAAQKYTGEGYAWELITDASELTDYLPCFVYPMVSNWGQWLPADQTFKNNEYNLDAFVSLFKSFVQETAEQEYDLTLTDKGTQQLWDICERYIYKTLEARSDFDAVITEYGKTSSDGRDTYTFTLDVTALLNKFAVFVNGAGKASGYNALRTDLYAYAEAREPGADAYAAMEWFQNEFSKTANEIGTIYVSLTVGHNRAELYELYLRCDNLDYEYHLTVSGYNDVTADTAALDAIFSEISG